MKYFSIAELCRSSIAERRRIKNEPTKAIEQNLESLVENVLDPLREAWGRPIIVNSGYRCAELNKAVGGSPTSHHLWGMAADITAGDTIANIKLFNLVLKLGLPFTQLIDEQHYTWLHISYDANNLKKEVRHL